MCCVHSEQAQHKNKDNGLTISLALAVNYADFKVWSLACRAACSSVSLEVHDKIWLQEKMRTTQKQLDDLTRQVSSLLSEKSQLETRTRILEQVVYLNTNHEQRLHANQAGCWCMGGLCLLSRCNCLVVAGQ